MLSKLPSFLSFLAAAVIGGLIVGWLGGSHEPAPTQGVRMPFMPLGSFPGVIEVTRLSSSARIKLGGYVEAREIVRLTAQAPGRVTFLAGEEGERVAAGQVVVALDDDAIRPQYRQAWASLSGEMAASQNAQTQLYHQLHGQRTSPMGGPGYEAYDRMATPFYNMAQTFMGQMMPGAVMGPNAPFQGPNGPMMTQAQSQRGFPVINQARADYERQMAALAAAQSQVDAVDEQLRMRRAIAPSAGAILARHVNLGDVVQPGMPLADIADVDALDVTIEVPTGLIGQIKMGDQIPVSLEGTNIWAPVSQIYPAADSTQRTITVKLALPAGSKAAPGMYALAWIDQGNSGNPAAASPAIPRSAVAYRGSLPVAFVAAADGTVQMRILRLGNVSGDRVAVLSGLEQGERIIERPGPSLKSGDSLFELQH